MSIPVEQAEAIADRILRAAGSGLRHYTMHSIRTGIVDEVQRSMDAVRIAAEEAQKERDAKLCDERATQANTSKLNNLQAGHKLFARDRDAASIELRSAAAAIRGQGR